MSKSALVVAIETYQRSGISPVDYAANDATAMAAALESHGYEVEVLLNEYATLSSFASRLNRLASGSHEDDEIVLYFAGHGFAAGGRTHLTVWDSDPRDLAGTSLPLADVYECLTKSEARRTLVLLDACHSGLPIDEVHRGPVVDTLDETELSDPPEYCWCLASCKPDEKSFPDGDRKHGIWTYFVLEALTGRAAVAANADGLVTPTSVLKHVGPAVKKRVRELHKLARQTPVLYGTTTGGEPSFDIRPHALALAEAAEAARQGPTGPIRLTSTVLKGVRTERVRDLSGFIRGRHRVPDSVNSATRSFAQRCAEQELQEKFEQLRQDVRREFRFKAAHLDISEDAGYRELSTPAFRASISVDLDPDDPNSVLWSFELVDINDPDLLKSGGADAVFREAFEVVELVFDGKPRDIERLVHAVEAQEDEGDVEVADYEANFDWCELRHKASGHRIVVHPDRVVLRSHRKSPPSALWHQLEEAVGDFQASRVRLITSKSYATPPPALTSSDDVVEIIEGGSRGVRPTRAKARRVD